MTVNTETLMVKSERMHVCRLLSCKTSMSHSFPQGLRNILEEEAERLGKPEQRERAVVKLCPLGITRLWHP